MQLVMSRTFPARKMDGFTFMMDPAGWPSWNPVTVRHAGQVSFASKGDTVAYGYKMLGLTVHGRLHLEHTAPGEFAAMRFVQGGFSDVTMRWDFHNAGAHAFTLTVTIDVLEPTWWEKTLHRASLLTPALRRDVHKAFDALHEHFVAQAETAKAS